MTEKMPLDGIILERKAGAFGKYFGTDKPLQDMLQNTSEKLHEAGINHHISHQTLNELRLGNSTFYGSDIGIPKSIPVIIELDSNPANIQKFLDRGGRLFENKGLQGVTFNRKAGADEITLPTDPKVKKLLNELGIKHTDDNNALTITGAHDICAVALSGGRFTGSREYLGKFGYHLG